MVAIRFFKRKKFGRWGKDLSPIGHQQNPFKTIQQNHFIFGQKPNNGFNTALRFLFQHLVKDGFT